MTLAQLNHAIATAEREFERINVRRDMRRVYRRINRDAERSLVELAERIARLHRFRGHLFAKHYALDSRD